APGGEAVGHRLELGAVAGFGPLRPLVQACIDWCFVARREGRLPVEVLLAQEAEIVLPPLEEGEAGVRAERGSERDVLVCELLLQRLGRGRDYDLESAPRGGQQVRERLAGAGARLHDQRAALGERPLDLLGHRDLRRTRLVGGQGPLDASPEKFGERGHSSLFTPRAALEARERTKG